MVVVIIGLDFGSSYTKVCYRLQGKNLDKGGVVKFTSNPDKPASLLSKSVIYRSKDFKYISYYPFSNSLEVKFFKSMLLKSDYLSEHGRKHKRLCSFYLACTLDIVKNYILDEEKELLNDREKIWILNLGIPVDENRIKLGETYKEMTEISILKSKDISRNNYRISLKGWYNWYEKGLNEKQDEMNLLFTPELLAGVVDIYDNHETKEGWSIIIDIGSATVDLAVVFFERLLGGQDNSIDIVSAKVSSLGVDSLVEYINKSEEWKNSIDINIKKALQTDNYFKNISNLLDKIVINNKSLNPESDNLKIIFYKEFATTYVDAKYREHFNKLVDNNFISLFLVGGGHEYYWYSRWPEGAYEKNQLRNTGLPRLRLSTLPPTTNSLQIASEYYHRFRVALGLIKLESPLNTRAFPWNFEKEKRENIIKNYKYKLEQIQRDKYGK